MKRKFTHSHLGASEIISSLLLLVISIVGASILAVFINNFFDAGLFSETDLNNPQNLFLIGYDTRDGTDLYGIPEIDNTCNSVIGSKCDTALLDGGSEYVVITIQNRGVSKVHINNIFINEFQHSWDSQTNSQALSKAKPSSGKFSILSSLTTRTQVSPDIESGKVGYVIVKLGSDMGSLENKKLVNIRVDEKGLDSQVFVIRIGMAT